jgi:hypothetical protein
VAASLIGASALTTVAGLIGFVILAGTIYLLYLLAIGAHSIGYANAVLLVLIAFGALWFAGLDLRGTAARQAGRQTSSPRSISSCRRHV